MNAKTFRKFLRANRACREARAWVRAHDYALREAWDHCERGDWLLWLAARLDGVDRRDLVRAACACARTTLIYMSDREDRPRLAIETVEAWSRGEATIKQVRAAAIGESSAALFAAPEPAAYAAAVAAKWVAYAAYACAGGAFDHAAIASDTHWVAFAAYACNGGAADPVLDATALAYAAALAAPLAAAAVAAAPPFAALFSPYTCQVPADQEQAVTTKMVGIVRQHLTIP